MSTQPELFSSSSLKQRVIHNAIDEAYNYTKTHNESQYSEFAMRLVAEVAALDCPASVDDVLIKYTSMSYDDKLRGFQLAISSNLRAAIAAFSASIIINIPEAIIFICDHIAYDLRASRKVKSELAKRVTPPCDALV